MTIRGLQQYGYDGIADLAAEKFVEHVYEVWAKTGIIWENCSADHVSQGKPVCAWDLVGWGGVGPIANLIENVIGISVNAPRNAVSWRIHRTSRHGIRNLQFGGNAVSLICAARTGAEQTPVITVDAKLEFRLTVDVAGRRTTRNFAAGAGTWRVD